MVPVMMVSNMGNEVSLSELMEVVTTYKCRFCAHTCPTTHEMADHVQRIHINPAAVAKELEAEGDLMGSMDNQEEQPGFGDAVPIMASLGLCPKSDAMTISVTSAPSKVVQVQSSSLPLATTTQGSIFTLSGGSGSITQNLAITAIQLTGSGLTLPAQPTAIDTLCMMDSNRELGTGPASVAPITRELFLCGICNLGFVTVDDCKHHMEREHGTSGLDSAPDVGEIDSKGRISVGTQVSGKRPGRKRKSEMPPPEETPALPKNMSTRREQRSDMKYTDDLNDEDWIPGYSLSVSKRDGRSKRKIRPPKALKDDYVLVKKRKYRKQRQVYKDLYTLPCTYLGCLAKFRTQSSLDVHLHCHNKEDMGFTCCECQEPFPVWKTLRVHLWRTHTMDVDLFQCDACDYKTDTLHKLGIHQEIHSDSRPYTCDVCGKGFKQLSQMKNHQVIHEEHRQASKATSGWFTSKTCEICGRTFANSKCLKKHVEAVHIKVKRYVCQYCNHSTARKAMMELHLRIHTGEKPFKCDVCPYATGDHNSLRRHKMRHTGQRQYKCQLCSYTCIQTISLKTHMRNKHPNAEGIFICPYCKFRTVNKQIFNNHQLDHRNGLIPTIQKVAGSADMGTVAIVGNASTAGGAPLQVQMQVQTMKTGEVQVSAEDLAKLSGVEGLVSGEISAAQLIYSALSVISQGGGAKSTTQTAQLLNGIQTTVTTSSAPSDKEGVSTHTITFRVPTAATPSADQPASQLLTEQSGPGQGESSETSSQSVDSVGDQDSQHTLSEDVQVFEQVTQVLCAQVPKLLAACNQLESGANLPQSTPDLQIVQMKYVNSEVDSEGDAASTADKNTAVFGASVVKVSESGSMLDQDDVRLSESGQKSSVIVTEGVELVGGVLVGGTGSEQTDDVLDSENPDIVIETDIADSGEDSQSSANYQDKDQVEQVSSANGETMDLNIKEEVDEI